MTKIFQVVSGFCYYDATRTHRDLKSTEGKYPPDILFVEAPNYVREGWGYDETKEGDERFIMPVAPDGWSYDLETGTFYKDGELKASQRERAYQSLMHKENGEAILSWEGKALTVDHANNLGLKYMAEGNEKAAELTKLIAAAKAYIRELYPVEE